MVLGWMMGTDPFVFEFQASVNKPFINFPALWRVSAHMVLDFCSLSWEMFVYCPGQRGNLPAHRQLHCGQTLSLSETVQSISQPCLSPSSPAPCPLHPDFISRVSFIPTEANTSWQTRSPVAHVHLGARERGVIETVPSLCPPSLLISSATPSLP